MPENLRYRRVLLKLSGEALCSRPSGSALDGPEEECGEARVLRQEALAFVAEEIAAARTAGAQIGVVVGAGNLLRGRSISDIREIPQATADQMGMLATVMNALALREVLDARGVPAVALSALPMGALCEMSSPRTAIAHLEAGRVVVFGGGTGNPFCTTDLAAALRACEISAHAVLKATKVDGVYDSDPIKNPAAKRYERLTYADALAQRLKVMDLSAVGMCMDNNVPVLVFRFAAKGNLARAVAGEPVGTLITD